ncbi:MAG: hypothetical protein ACT4PZ_03850 [Panacagrimonas sp.]
MNCEDFRELLDDEPDTERQGRMFAHAADCPRCRARLEFESLLHRQLRTLPIPVPRAGFAERVLADAHRAQPRTQRAHHAQRRALVWAMAASWVLALGLWFAYEPVETQIANVAIDQPFQVQPVRLLFRSATALTGVSIDLALPEGVELAGYPGQRQLSWQTDLAYGPNLLELPVLVRGSGGVLTATLNLGGERRQFTVQVQATPPSGERLRKEVSRV